MASYIEYTRRLAEATPPERNRVVDFWRAAAICVVVFGHWLAASIWVTPDGEIELLNSLEWVPYAGWITWIVQVMPIFFLAGGYANARGLGRVERGEQLRGDGLDDSVTGEGCKHRKVSPVGGHGVRRAPFVGQLTEELADSLLDLHWVLLSCPESQSSRDIQAREGDSFKSYLTQSQPVSELAHSAGEGGAR